jgi:hypothetical protein
MTSYKDFSKAVDSLTAEGIFAKICGLKSFKMEENTPYILGGFDIEEPKPPVYIRVINKTFIIEEVDDAITTTVYCNTPDEARVVTETLDQAIHFVIQTYKTLNK